jgi:hypothetical protein
MKVGARRFAARNTLKNFCTRIQHSNGIETRMLQEPQLKSTKQMASTNNVSARPKNRRSETKSPQYHGIFLFEGQPRIFEAREKYYWKERPPKNPTHSLEIDGAILPQVDRSFEDDISESDAYQNIDNA